MSRFVLFQRSSVFALGGGHTRPQVNVSICMFYQNVVAGLGRDSGGKRSLKEVKKPIVLSDQKSGVRYQTPRI